MNDDRYLITGCNDKELRVWKITFLDNKSIEFDTAVSALNLNEENEENEVNEESVDTDMVCYLYFYILHF